MTPGHVTLAAIPFRLQPQSTHFSAMYCSYIGFLHAVFKYDAENGKVMQKAIIIVMVVVIIKALMTKMTL
jgi:hypothetical protein